MNAFKRYARSKGIKLEQDYECLPCGGLDTVKVDSENATIAEYYYCYGWTYTVIRRDGTIDGFDSRTDLDVDRVAEFLKRGTDGDFVEEGRNRAEIVNMCGGRYLNWCDGAVMGLTDDPLEAARVLLWERIQNDALSAAHYAGDREEV